MARRSSVRPGAELAATLPRAHAARLGTGWEAPVLLVCALLLLSFGLVVVYSASAVQAQESGLPDYYFLVRQAVGGVAGVVVLAVLARIDYRLLRVLAWPLVAAISAVLLLMVLPGTEGLAPPVNGSRRWLLLGSVAVQPSEAAKFALIAWTAMLTVRKQDRLHSLSRGLLPFLLIWAVVAVPVLLQPDLSTALLILLLAGLVAFAGGARIGHFVLLGLLAAPAVWFQIRDAAYRMSRIDAFLDPTRDPAGMSYQITQSLIALGSGGIVGRGVGEGQQKFGFLPEPYNDFVFSMIGEEWGFVGVAVVVAAFAAFALVGYRVARNAPDLFGFLLAVGMTNLIVVQALLHMGVTTGLLPTTGVTLPFVSYGRSSLLVCMAAVGVLLSIARAGAAEREEAA